MTKFFLALFSLYFSLLTFAFAASSASSSPSKHRNGRSIISYSSKKTREPAWFKKSVLGRSEQTWNVFGQWFNQFKSKPFGHLVHLKSIRNVNEFWSMVSTKQLDDVDRIDISIFRPGFEPDYEKFVSSANGFILSYKVNYKTIQKPSTSPSKSKTSRNEALKAKDFEATSPLDGPYPYLRVFDPLIKAAMENEDPTFLTSKIIGFIFKRQYDNTFIQVFFDGPGLRRRDGDVFTSFINDFICQQFPTVSLKTPLKLKLSEHSSKIAGVLASPSGDLKEAASLTVEEESVVKEQHNKEELKEDKDEEEDVKLVIEVDEEEGKLANALDEEDGKLENSNETLISDSESDNIFRTVESEDASAAILESVESSSDKNVPASFDEEDLHLYSDASDDSYAKISNDEERDVSVSSSSYETAEEDEVNIFSNLSTEAPVFVPTEAKTILDKLFEIMFTEDFGIFLGDQNKLIKHFERVLIDLVLEHSTDLENNELN